MMETHEMKGWICLRERDLYVIQDLHLELANSYTK